MKHFFGKAMSLSLIFIMLFSMVSCNSGENTNSSTTMKTSTTGRYFEQPLDFSPMAIGKLSDESIRSFAYEYSEDLGPTYRFGTSTDGGKTWTFESNEEVNQFLRENVVLNFSFDSEGNLYLLGTPMKKEDTETPTAYSNENAKIYRINKDFSIETLNYETNNSDQNSYVNSFKILKNGDILAQYMESYAQIDPTTGKNRFTYKSGLMGRTYAVDGETLIFQSDEGIDEYNSTTGEKISSMKWPSGIPLLTTGSWGIQPSTDKKGYIYFCGQGIYYIPKDESTPEVLMDSSSGSSIFSGEEYYLKTFIYNEDKSFLAGTLQGQNAKFSYFRYDPDAPSTPDKTIQVYSLKENAFVRQAVVDFQLAHPEVLINYKVGIIQDSMGMSETTEEDALKDLALKIQAGEGPDIMLLDGLPIEKYQKSGMFYDLTEYIESRKESKQFLENMIDAFQVDGSYYALPTHFVAPAITGKGIGEISSLSDYSDWLGKQDKKQINGQKDIVFRQFYNALYSGWFKEDGSLNEEQIRSDLVALKSIYDMQEDTSGIRYAGFSGSTNADTIDSMVTESLMENNIDHLMGNMGTLNDYRILTGYASEKAEDWSLFPSENSLIVPQDIIGITKTAKDPKLCEEFLDAFLVSKDTFATFSVSAMEIKSRIGEELFQQDELRLGSVDENGMLKDATLAYLPLDEKVIDTLYEKIGNASVSKADNAVVRNILFTEIQSYLGAVPDLNANPDDENGVRPKSAQDLDKTLNNMKSKVGLYLSE